MIPSSDRAVTSPCPRSAVGARAVTLTLTVLMLAGCGVVAAASSVVHTAQNNKAVIGQFTGQLQSGTATPFEATYVTSGSSQATIVYAVRPPNQVAFQEGDSGNGAIVPSLDVFANTSGEYSCARLDPLAYATSRWSCRRLGPAGSAAQNKIFDFYTPQHWVAFLNDLTLAASFAGDKVTKSAMTVNGFSLHCVNFTATGIAATSTVCSTAQGIIGYVNVTLVSSVAETFEIKAYSASPPASLFQPPPGARITG